MRIIKINPNNPHSKAIEDAVNILKNGGVLVYPTDTCYGIGADMNNIIAVDKIYKIKQRTEKKPLSVIVKNLDTVKKITLVEHHQEEILQKYLPGPFTFILLNIDFKTFSQNSLGIRIPDYKITQLISYRFNRPYATTSANITGENPCYSVKEILGQFKNNKEMPNLILDAGTLKVKKTSTVVDITHWPPIILRQGEKIFEY